MIKFATVGAGWIVDSFLKGAKENAPDFVHDAVYSFSDEEGQAFGAKHGITRIFNDLDKLGESDIDAVYIANPNAFHYPTAKVLLEHGKNVICEKTSVITSAQLANLYKIADEHNVIFMEAMKGLYLPEIDQLTESFKKLGEIHMAKFDFCRYSSKMPALKAGEFPNIFNPRMGAGGLMDMGIYLVYPALYWFGVPNRIQADISLMSTGADACGTVLFNCDPLQKDGSFKNIQVTISYGKTSTSKADNLIMGDLGVLHIDTMECFDNSYIEYVDGTREVITKRDTSFSNMGGEALQFYKYITDREGTAKRYAESRKLTTEVIATMEQIRDIAGIEFPEEIKAL